MASTFCVTTGPISLAASVTKTMIQLLAASAGGIPKVVDWDFSVDGSTAGLGIRVTLLRQTTGGTVGVAMAAANLDNVSGDGAATSATQAAMNASVEPTSGDLLKDVYWPPNAGPLNEKYPLQREYGLAYASRLGIRVITPAGMTTLNGIATLWLEE